MLLKVLSLKFAGWGLDRRKDDLRLRIESIRAVRRVT